jgi:enoyl-CoA hydratase/carnithine racemase
MPQTISTCYQGDIAIVTIDNEAKRNALTQSMWEAVAETAQALQQHQHTRVVVVRGAGDKAFSAGADIAEFTELAKDPEKLALNNAAVQLAQQALEQLTKPTIAMIHGACVGGGCGLALACDFRFADARAKFAITPARLGLLYSKNDTRRLYNLVGPGLCRQMLYTGKSLQAEEALEAGLLTDVVSEGLQQHVLDFAAELAAGSQYSMRGIKQVLASLEGHGSATDEELQQLFDAAFSGEDCLEGAAAFLQKRPARFSFQ